MRAGMVLSARCLNRRRYLPELKSPIASVRQFAERMAINTPIQGTAADLIKVAMVNIAHLLTKEKSCRPSDYAGA